MSTASGSSSGEVLTPSPTGASTSLGGGETSNLADVLERVLDKGVVIAGDIQVNLLDIELLTIKLRLVIASVDTARRMGIRWWETDPALAGGQEDDSRSLHDRVRRLERQLERGASTDERPVERQLEQGSADE